MASEDGGSRHGEPDPAPVARPSVDPGTTADRGPVPATMAHPTAVLVIAILGVTGIAAYIAAWAIAGAITPDYDPLRQAISETFAIGAPGLPATLVRASLVVSGAALVAFGWALDRGLPGRGRAAPVSCAVSGVLTMLVVAVPCTAGCPGVGASLTDTLHAIVAGGGYLTLLLTPLFAAVRLRDHAPRLAAWSAALGGVALTGFLVRNLGVEVASGLQQRIFNTLGDAWYLLVAVVLARRAWTARGRERGRSDRGRKL